MLKKGFSQTSGIDLSKSSNNNDIFPPKRTTRLREASFNLDKPVSLNQHLITG